MQAEVGGRHGRTAGAAGDEGGSYRAVGLAAHTSAATERAPHPKKCHRRLRRGTEGAEIGQRSGQRVDGATTRRCRGIDGWWHPDAHGCGARRICGSEGLLVGRTRHGDRRRQRRHGCRRGMLLLLLLLRARVASMLAWWWWRQQSAASAAA